MTTTDLLANIRVASPCSAHWADMTGDERSRFCALCRKHVYNLSEMTAEEAAGLIREKEGKLCVRFYQRADGTILTADCPVGVAAVMQRVKRLVAVGIGVLVPAFAAPAFVRAPELQPQPRCKLYQAWDKTLFTVKNWVKPPPPAPPTLPPTPPRAGAFEMGDVCLPSPARSKPPPASTQQ